MGECPLPQAQRKGEALATGKKYPKPPASHNYLKNSRRTTKNETEAVKYGQMLCVLEPRKLRFSEKMPIAQRKGEALATGKKHPKPPASHNYLKNSRRTTKNETEAVKYGQMLCVLEPRKLRFSEKMPIV